MPSPADVAQGTGNFPLYATRRLIGGVIKSWNQGPAFRPAELERLRQLGYSVRYMGRGVPQIFGPDGTISVRAARRLLTQSAAPVVPGLEVAGAAGRFVYGATQGARAGAAGAVAAGGYLAFSDRINRAIYNAWSGGDVERREKLEKQLEAELTKRQQETADYRAKREASRRKYAETLSYIDPNELEVLRDNQTLATRQVYEQMIGVGGVEVGRIAYYREGQRIAEDPWKVAVRQTSSPWPQRAIPGPASATLPVKVTNRIVMDPSMLPSVASAAARAAPAVGRGLLNWVTKNPTWAALGVSTVLGIAASSRAGSKRKSQLAPVPGPGISSDSQGLTYIQPSVMEYPAYGPKGCHCPTTSKAKRSKKRRCSNPRVRSRKYFRGGQQYQTITRRIECRA